jgi:dCMP deaminase
MADDLIKANYLALRPSWDEYFLLIAFIVSLRSQDPNIHHGAIVVDENNHIIGTGYNGPIKLSNDKIIPWHNRDQKRKWMIHAEENCLLNCTKPGSSHNSFKMYVTGTPCNNCLQRIINFGIKNIIIADRIGSITENEETQHMKEQLITMSNINIKTMSTDNMWLQKYFLGVL